MLLRVKVPKITEENDFIKLVTWYVKDRDFVKKEFPLCLLETSKALIEVPAEKDGFVRILKEEGEFVSVEETICLLADNSDELLE